MGSVRSPKQKAPRGGGPERLTSRLSELAGLILAAQKRLLNSLARFSGPLFLVDSGIRTPNGFLLHLLHLLRVALRATISG